MRDSRDRVTIATWNKLKKYMSYNDSDGYTPTFGYVVDKFRTEYSIYISVTPITKSNVSSSRNPDDTIIFGYRSEIYKLSGNNVIIHWTGNDQAFYQAMRDAINKAIEFIDD